MSARGDLRRVIARAERQGFRHEILGSGHHRFYAPNNRSIVQCSATMREGGWWHRFMLEMKKAGYQHQEQRTVSDVNNTHATTSLGDALQSALKTPAVAPRGTYANLVRAAMQREPEHWFCAASVKTLIHAAGFTAYTETSAGALLATLCKQGQCHRGDPGWYRHAAPNPERALKALLPSPATTVSCDATGDDRELDEALAALGRIETVINEALNDVGRIEAVVRKYKHIIAQVRQMKTLLDGVK